MNEKVRMIIMRTFYFWLGDYAAEVIWEAIDLKPLFMAF